jgi:hypothetical protein
MSDINTILHEAKLTNEKPPAGDRTSGREIYCTGKLDLALKKAWEAYIKGPREPTCGKSVPWSPVAFCQLYHQK